jgi:hypothetical protein
MAEGGLLCFGLHGGGVWELLVHHGPTLLALFVSVVAPLRADHGFEGRQRLLVVAVIDGHDLRRADRD